MKMASFDFIIIYWQYGCQIEDLSHRTLQIVSIIFLISLTSGQVNVIFKLGHDLLNDLGTRSTGQIYHAKREPPLRAFIRHLS